MTAQWAVARHVALDGAVNVRDVGGYQSSYGLQVARGLLFRGDALSQLSGLDRERIDRLGLRTVIDFRSPGEVLLSGADRLPFGVQFVSLPVGGGDLGAVYELIASGDHERQRRELGDGRAAEFMVEINRGFVADARQREAFGAALRVVCAAGRLPLLYHCSGGKDRTGWMTAIVLTVLGVPREFVLRDYLLSNDFHRTGYQKLRFDLVKTGIVADPELLRPILEQSATYLGAAFEEADRRYWLVRAVRGARAGGQRRHAGRAAARPARRPGAARAGAVSARSDPVSLCGGAARGGASGPRRAAQR